MHRATCWFLASVALCVGTPAFALPESTWLVAIGANAGDVEDVGLLYAERDAREVAEVLRTEGGVATHRILLLLGADAQTVRQELLRINTAIRAVARAGGTATALVVFYSGHADADALHMGRSTLPFDELRALVESSPASLRLLVVDACRSGSVTRVKGVEPADTFEIALEEIALEEDGGAEGMAILTSSAAGESSQESDRLRASFFTHHLINALRGAADRNGDGQVTLGEAYGYTYAQTLRSSGRTLDLQHPTYRYDVKGRGELVLTAPGADTRGTGLLRLAEAGTYLVTEQRGGGPVVAEISPPRDRARLALPASGYFVQHRRATELREYEVTVVPGREVDLAEVPYHAVGYDRLVRRRGGARSYVHGLTAIAGARGEVLEGEGPTPQLVLGYGVDLPWLTLGLRVRGATVGVDGFDGAAPRRHWELGLGLTLQRFIDLRWVSLSFGLLVEGVWHHQTFDTSRDAEARSAVGASFAGLFTLERSIVGGLAVHLEAGPVTTLFEQTTTERGVATGQELHTSFTWWAAGGLVWRL